MANNEETIKQKEYKLIHQEGGNSITRSNMLEDPNYTGYCGESWDKNCSMPRTEWDKELGQFKCPYCGWVSEFPREFMEYYRSKWNK